MWPFFGARSRKMRHSWDEARPAVRAVGKRKVFIRFDVVLRRLEHAKDFADYVPRVQVERREADNLENLFASGANKLPNREAR
jgi:hypothetical protein